MSSEEEFRKKENQYEYYGVCTSTIKNRVTESLQDIAKSALIDIQKKLGVKYPEEKVKETIEKMQTEYLNATNEFRHNIDDLVDNTFKVPSTDELTENPLPSEENLDKKIKLLQTQLESLHDYHSDLLKYENLVMKEEEMMDFTDQHNRLQKMEATSQQLHNESQSIHDLFRSKEVVSTKELEDTVMNMSLG